MEQTTSFHLLCLSLSKFTINLGKENEENSCDASSLAFGLHIHLIAIRIRFLV